MRRFRKALIADTVALVLFLLTGPMAFANPSMEVQRVTSPGGIEAWLVEDHSNPILSIAFGFRVGTADDPEGKEGLAEMVSGLLDEGAGDLDSQAFQKRLADLAIDLDFDVGRDDFTGTMRTLSENRDAAFDLLRLALTEPRFDPGPIERIRGQMLVLLARMASEPMQIADQVWWRTLFPDHPYGRRPLGTPETLAAIAPEDLRRFVDRHFARDNLVVGVVGDITAEELAPLLDKTFGGLPARAAPVPMAEAEPGNLGELVVVERAVPQSTVLFGAPGIKRDDPDFYAAMLVNHVLGGGGFSSRLTNEVREKRGLAYSVGSYLLTLDHAGLLRGYVATQNARVADSIAIIREEWRRMREEGPTAEELADAKTYVIGSYPLQFTSTASTAEGLVAVQLERLGIDYFDRREALINAVTLEDARRVARRLLDPATLTAVVVGTPEGLAATLPAPGDGT
jgi:zinc protease